MLFSEENASGGAVHFESWKDTHRNTQNKTLTTQQRHNKSYRLFVMTTTEWLHISRVFGELVTLFSEYWQKIFLLQFMPPSINFLLPLSHVSSHVHREAWRQHVECCHDSQWGWAATNTRSDHCRSWVHIQHLWPHVKKHGHGKWQCSNLGFCMYYCASNYYITSTKTINYTYMGKSADHRWLLWY